MCRTARTYAEEFRIHSGGECFPQPLFSQKEWLMTMSLDDVKKRFVEEVKLRAYDDKYIDKNEEREILQIAIQQGIGVDPARAALVQVCDSQGYVMESK